MKIVAIIGLLCSLWLLSGGCHNHIQENAKIVTAAIHEENTEKVDEKKIPGYLLGVSWEKNEVFVNSLFPEKRKYIVKIIVPQTGLEKRIISLDQGDSQSPTLFTNPTYIEYLNGKYFIIDHKNKIVAHDTDFKYLYSVMFNNYRTFIDFFTFDNGIYFVFGKSRHLQDKYRYNIELYRMFEGKKPDFFLNLLETYHEAPYSKNTDKNYHIIYFRSSNWGFEKGGDVFYTDNRDNIYYRYDLSKKRRNTFELPYLKGKKYSKEEAEMAAHYKNMDIKIPGLMVVYVSAEEPTYHQGLYDIGKEKIGIATDVDMKSLTYRLDIFDSRSGKYLYSIRLPFGEGFIRRTSGSNLGYLQTYINIDLGLYVWSDVADNSRDCVVKITQFKLKTGSINP